jgi:hypothetical protein
VRVERSRVAGIVMVAGLVHDEASRLSYLADVENGDRLISSGLNVFRESR